eukprot:GHUV01026282.1.p1 GENE.GHUV01026282.1~~GHUV01026282.1.p1  ORF type:complete len:142 (-),score=30.64 GHUV01026282.1:1249-1674(-)
MPARSEALFKPVIRHSLKVSETPNSIVGSQAAAHLTPLLSLVQEILDVEQVTEESQGLELSSENVDQVSSSYFMSRALPESCSLASNVLGPVLVGSKAIHIEDICSKREGCCMCQQHGNIPAQPQALELLAYGCCLCGDSL